MTFSFVGKGYKGFGVDHIFITVSTLTNIHFDNLRFFPSFIFHKNFSNSVRSLFVTTPMLTYLTLVSSAFQQSEKKFHLKMQKSFFFIFFLPTAMQLIFCLNSLYSILNDFQKVPVVK